jgi:hypothetical protein
MRSPIIAEHSKTPGRRVHKRRNVLIWCLTAGSLALTLYFWLRTGDRDMDPGAPAPQQIASQRPVPTVTVLPSPKRTKGEEGANIIGAKKTMAAPSSGPPDSTTLSEKLAALSSGWTRRCAELYGRVGFTWDEEVESFRKIHGTRITAAETLLNASLSFLPPDEPGFPVQVRKQGGQGDDTERTGSPPSRRNLFRRDRDALESERTKIVESSSALTAEELRTKLTEWEGQNAGRITAHRALARSLHERPFEPSPGKTPR